MIVGAFKMGINKVNIKNRAYNYYFDNLIKAKKLETKKFYLTRKTIRT